MRARRASASRLTVEGHVRRGHGGVVGHEVGGVVPTEVPGGLMGRMCRADLGQHYPI